MNKLNSKTVNKISKILLSCTLCERKCGVNRHKGEKGICGLGSEAYIFKDFIHLGEEGDLSPSHAIYLSGCNLRCSFCDNTKFVKKPILQEVVNPKTLSDRIIISQQNGAKNVNWVGGEPTVNLFAIAKTLLHLNPSVKIIWNSNMLATMETLEIIDSFTDVYLADFKFGNNSCAMKIAEFNKYFEIVSRNLKHINKDKRLIIRHLPLKGHIECCTKPIFKWIKDNLPKAEISLIKNFIPSDSFNSEISQPDIKNLEKLLKTYKLKIVPESKISKTQVKMDGEKIEESNIFIKPDGSIVFQDLNASLANIIFEISF